MDVGWAQDDAGAIVSGHQQPGELVAAVTDAYMALHRPTSPAAEGPPQP
jgi:hypothetical protein